MRMPQCRLGHAGVQKLQGKSAMSLVRFGRRAQQTQIALAPPARSAHICRAPQVGQRISSLRLDWQRGSMGDP